MNGPEEQLESPQNQEAERNLLSAMLLSSIHGYEALDYAAETLRSGYFYFPAHQAIFQGILDCRKSEGAVDLIVLANFLGKHKLTDKCGGAEYIAGLTKVANTVENCEHYARIIAEKAALRQIIKVAAKATAFAYQGKNAEDIQTFLLKLTADVEKLMEYQGEDYYKFLDDYQREIRRLALQGAEGEETSRGLLTGYPGFDRESGGLHPGRLYSLIGRNKHAKTTMALNLGEGFIENNPDKYVLMFSMEMRAEAVLDKLLAIRHAKATDPDKVPVRAIQSKSAFRAIPLVGELGLKFGYNWLIVQRRGLTTDEITRLFRRVKHLYSQVGLVIIDYLQKVRDPSGKRDYVHYETACGGIFDESGECEVSTLLIAQAGRGVAREHRMPDDADVYGGDALDQYADQMNAIHDPYYARPKEARTFEASNQPRMLQLRTLKNKYGPVLDWQVTFWPKVGLILPERISALTKKEGPEPPLPEPELDLESDEIPDFEEEDFD